jgi:hypothetical protein
MIECSGSLHPRSREGLQLFNDGQYFEAHEALEDAWKQERGVIRDLYRGILQVAVVYLHITRRNYSGALKVYERSTKWLKDWPRECRGIEIDQLRRDAAEVIELVRRMPTHNPPAFDPSFLRPVIWKDTIGLQSKQYICDRCGHEMKEKNCKVICPNCGNQFDCSDLTLHFE